MTLLKKAAKAKAPHLNVQILIRQRRFKIYADSTALFCTELLSVLGHPGAALAVTFVGARKMRQLNQEYRGKDYATDVLSFGYDSEWIEGTPFLGDIVISPATAYKQALDAQVDPESEMRMLLLHGILHLLGYDHETDRGEMKRLQQGIMRRRVFGKSAPIADMRGRA